MQALLLSILGIGKVLWAFIIPLLAGHTAAILSGLLPIAIETVRDLNSSSVTSVEKRAAAAAKVKAIAEAEGIKAFESLINLSVELALQKLRAEEIKAVKPVEKVVEVKPEEKK